MYAPVSPIKDFSKILKKNKTSKIIEKNNKSLFSISKKLIRSN